MIIKKCEACNHEYRPEFTNCSDCGGKLATIEQAEGKAYELYDFRYFKLGANLLFGIISQLIIVLIAYDFYFTYKLKNEGISAPAYENIPPFIWVALIIETGIAVYSFYVGYKKNREK